MISDRDFIASVRKRYQEQIRQKEREIEELKHRDETLRDIDNDLAGGALPIAEKNTQSPERLPSRYNLMFAKHIGEYVAAYPFDQAININQMLDTLKKEKGIQGKPNSLYAYAHSVLRRKAETHEHDLHYEKGVGFYKTRGEDKNLVASIGPEGFLAEKGETRGG